MNETQSENIKLIETKEINLVPVDGYYGLKDAWFTRYQIGATLGYNHPASAIEVIHLRHKNRLDPLARVIQIESPSGRQATFIYNLKGVLEICRWSKQPKADMVMDALYDMAQDVMRKGYYSAMSDDALLSLLSTRLRENPRLIKQAEISRHNEKYLRSFTVAEQVQELWGKRFDLSQDEYTTQLANICDDDLTLYSREWCKYNKWRCIYRMSKA